MANLNHILALESPPNTPLIDILKKRASHSQVRRKHFPVSRQWESRIGYVYLIHFVTSDIYKIGVSQDVNRRLKEFCADIPIKLEIEHIIPTDDMPVVETSFHEYFQSKRIQGEWFELNRSDIELFKSIEEISIHFLTTE